MMYIYPMKQLIIIYGIHLEKIGIRNSEEGLKKVLNDQKFTLTNDLREHNISIYKNREYNDQNKRTHIIINLGGEVSQIDYYTTKE